MSVKQGGKTIAGATQYHPDLFDFKWADHILNDAQWLMANTFSWQYGSMYQAAYQHLADDLDGVMINWYAWRYSTTVPVQISRIYTKSSTPSVGDAVFDYQQGETAKTITAVNEGSITVSDGKVYARESSQDITTGGQSETIAGVTIIYYLAQDGHKLVLPDQESNVAAIYNATGVAWYYIIDTTNQRFKLPRKHSQQIVRSVKNADGSWYRLYADGWVEQGGLCSGTEENNPVTMPIEMSNTEYQVLAISDPTDSVNGWGWITIARNSKTTTGFSLSGRYGSGNVIPVRTHWQVSGQSAIDMSSFQDSEKYLYFYVGTFTQTAIENTAGLNTELFNQKADLNLSNAASNIDFVIESQEPTAANNYTWYRKYKSGWVEQGGQQTVNTVSSAGITITLPVAMADANYTIAATVTGQQAYLVVCINKTATSFLWRSFNTNAEGYDKAGSWQVSGIAA